MARSFSRLFSSALHRIQRRQDLSEAVPPTGKWQVRALNRTLITMLRRDVQKLPSDWEPLLPAVLQAYRSTP